MEEEEEEEKVVSEKVVEKVVVEVEVEPEVGCVCVCVCVCVWRGVCTESRLVPIPLSSARWLTHPLGYTRVRSSYALQAHSFVMPFTRSSGPSLAIRLIR